MHENHVHERTKRRGAVLRVMCLSLMMVVAAVASLNVALPEIARDTGATQTQLQWIVDAYALVFAALLLPAGRSETASGASRSSSLGLGLFGLASLTALFFHSPDELIGLRAVMGVGAAFVMPVTLSVITTIFPPEERGKAVGTWVGVAAGGAVIGLLVSGCCSSGSRGRRSSGSTSCWRSSRSPARSRSCPRPATPGRRGSTRSARCSRSSRSPR